MSNIHGSALTMVEWRPSDYKKIIERLEKIAGKRMVIRKAIELAAKRAADTGVTMTKRGIAADTTLKSSEIGKRVKAYKYGSPLGMSIGMKISDTARPLSEFSFSPKKPKKGVPPTVEVYKGTKTTFDKGAFIADVSAGEGTHTGIFERVGDERLPITTLYGPSVTGIFKANENVHTVVWNAMFETFEKRVEHELERLLDA